MHVPGTFLRLGLKVQSLPAFLQLSQGIWCEDEHRIFFAEQRSHFDCLRKSTSIGPQGEDVDCDINNGLEVDNNDIFELPSDELLKSGAPE